MLFFIVQSLLPRNSHISLNFLPVPSCISGKEWMYSNMYWFIYEIVYLPAYELDYFTKLNYIYFCLVISHVCLFSLFLLARSVKTLDYSNCVKNYALCQNFQNIVHNAKYSDRNKMKIWIKHSYLLALY